MAFSQASRTPRTPHRIAALLAAAAISAASLVGCSSSDPVDSPLVDRTWQITAAWDTPDAASDAPVYGFTATPELAFSEKGVTGNTGCEAFVAKAQWPDAEHVTISKVKFKPTPQSDNVLETCTEDARNFADRVKRIVDGEFRLHRAESDMRLSRADEDPAPGQSPRGLGLTSGR